MPKPTTKQQHRYRKTKQQAQDYDYLAFCFQGGGALGAYQVGVLQALLEADYQPDWFVGISIGAINAAIAAGNPPQERISQLKAFWQTIATPEIIPTDQIPPFGPIYRRTLNFMSSQVTAIFGQPGFFTPRLPPAIFDYKADPSSLSYYDTTPLLDTINKFVDFKRINAGGHRLAIGAVNVATGCMKFFDSAQEKITAEHIMASCALPPGFPAVKIADEYYWDGGISCNTPLHYVLNNQPSKALLCFLIHLFDSYGMIPTNMDDVTKRRKDITFSSLYKNIMEIHQELHILKFQVHELARHLPKEFHQHHLVQKCLNNGWDNTTTLVRFVYEGDEAELASKDYEFSNLSIKKHMQQGYADVQRCFPNAPWQSPPLADEGIKFYDMVSPSLQGKINEN